MTFVSMDIVPDSPGTATSANRLWRGERTVLLC